LKYLRWIGIGVYVTVGALPLLWLLLTSLKPHEDVICPHAKFVPLPGAEAGGEGVTFSPTLKAYTALHAKSKREAHSFFHYLWNSVIIGVLSTLCAVTLGTMCAYGFSRFRIGGAQDWLFFVLSTRFLPPLAVVVPILLMYRTLGLQNSHLGLVLLYTSFNLSLAVWLMKGFIDEIPRAYEEAALVDGYSRLQAFFRIIVPEAGTGIAVTAVFCVISAVNEYGFAVTLNQYRARTVPVFFAGLQGNIRGVPWPQLAAGTLLFVAPIVVFTVLVRKHLLRGVTFGTIKR